MAKRRKRRSRRASPALALALSGFIAPLTLIVRRSRRRLKVDEDKPDGYLFVEEDSDDL